VTGLDWEAGAGRFDIGGRSLEWGAWGPPPSEASTLVMLHEGLGCLALWRDAPARLAELTGMGVFAWSRAGYGHSEARGLPWPLDFMEQEAAENVPAVLDAIGIQSGILVGHSDGASISAIFAGRHGDPRIKGVVLIAPHVFTEPGGQASIAETRDAYESGGLRERLGRYHKDPDEAFGGWAGVWLHPEFAGTWSIADTPRGFRVPVLAIQGAEDEYGTLAHIKAVERGSPMPVERLIIPDCRHAPHLEKPDEALPAIARFAGACLG